MNNDSRLVFGGTDRWRSSYNYDCYKTFEQNFYRRGTTRMHPTKDHSKKGTMGPFWKKDLFLWCLLFGRFEIARTIWLGYSWRHIPSGRLDKF